MTFSSIEEPFFPGTPERYIKLPISTTVSKDGVQLIFVKTIDLEQPKQSPVIELSINDGQGVGFSNKVLEDLGKGSIEAGLAVLADRATGLDYATVHAGSADPLYDAVIFPFYGGEDKFVAAMEAKQ